MNLILEVTCPECGEECWKTILLLTMFEGRTPVVPLMAFEQESWTCDHCEATVYTGDMEVMVKE